jgi:serine/threonine-protein kinase
MAKLSHPNVVAIYDVEDVATEGIVLVMEYVPGTTLRGWRDAQTRSWRDILRHFVAAGRGLAAAHAAGLTHRDFKPANVLVSSVDGVVKVTDFGLAKARGAVESGSSIDGNAKAESLSRADEVMGTPRYMAPEQHAGESVGPAADQYAFCVAVWEALCDEPPFSGKDLVAAKRDGPPSWPNTTVARAIVEAIRRGLTPDPVGRWGSMEALLERLEYDPKRRRAQWLLGAGGVGMLGVLGISQAMRRDEACTGAEEAMAGVWDDARREEVRTAMLAVDVPFAASTWERTRAALDDLTHDWVAMHTETCEATTIRGEQSTAVMDLRMSCLQRFKLELGAATSVLADADRDIVQRAHKVVGGLSPLSRCADLAVLQADVEPPMRGEQATVERIRSLLADSRAARLAGRYARAREHVEAAAASLETLEYAPVRTEVWLEEGLVLDEVGEYDAAEAALKRALGEAARYRQEQELWNAAAQLMYVLGTRQRDPEAALRYRELAEGLAEGDERREAAVEGRLAIVLNELGELDESEAMFRRSLEHRARVYGADHPSLAPVQNNLATLLQERGRYEEAEAEHRRAIALAQKSLGDEHPDVALYRQNLAISLEAQGKYDEAEAEYRRALALWQHTIGPKHPNVATALGNLGGALQMQMKYDEAEPEFRRAWTIFRDALGPEHPTTLLARLNLAGIHKELGRLEESETAFSESLPPLAEALGADHRQVTQLRHNYATLLEEQERTAEAEAEHRRVIASWERTLDPDHPNLAAARAALAHVLLWRGAYDEALVLAEQAWHRHQRDDIAPAVRADTAFWLAQARWETDSDPKHRAEAHALAASTLDAYESIDDTESLAEVRAWLARHR